MTDKVQKIKDWISCQQDSLIDANGNFQHSEDEAAYHTLCNLDAYIDSLQEEPVSEDMWEVSKQYALRQVLASTDTEMSEQAYLDLRLFSGLELAIAHKDGAEWQKGQMMANVIDGLWIRRNRYTKINVLQNFDTTHAVFQQFKNGDKVKMVLIKED